MNFDVKFNNVSSHRNDTPSTNAGFMFLNFLPESVILISGVGAIETLIADRKNVFPAASRSMAPRRKEILTQ